jgi:tetratricopeptide (TPR) repeat protein
MDAGILAALATLEAEPDDANALATLSSLIEGGGNGKGAQQAAAADTSVRRALKAAQVLHRERGEFELVVRLIDLELGWETDKDRKADLYFEKAKLLADELLREDEALRCYERVLELRPEDEGAQDAVGHIALVRDNWQKIVKKYLEEAKDSTDRQLTTSLYLSVAEIYAKYQADDHVEKYLQQALEVEPRNLKASLRLERLYRGEQRWEDLVKLLESRVEAATTKEERVQAYLTLAEIEGKRRGRPAEAAEAYKKALGIDPASQKALRALVEHYTTEENWSALIRVYENALRARPRGEPELGMYLQIGMLWWKKLGNLDSADEYWKRVRKAEPAHPAMIDFYRELYGREPQKLLPVLQQAQKVEADAGRRLQLSVEMAQLAERASGSVEKAIDLWKSVLKIDAAHPQAFEAVRRLYQQTEKWNALLELLKERVEALPKDAVDQRVAGLLEVVAIYRDKLNLDVMVINTYNHILQLKADHLGALEALAAKYEAMGRWNDLIGVLQRTADVLSEPAAKAKLLQRIASLWIDKFGNFNQAVKPLEELYAIQPVDAETVGRLRDIYTRRRSWRALLDLERKELERALSADARRLKLMEIARLAADRLGDAREAIALWNRLLEEDERDGEALSALAGLYEREKRWLGLIECLRRQKDLQPATPDGVKAQVVLLERIGALYGEKLQAAEQAISAYQEIVLKMPGHPKAMRTLRELYAQGQHWDELEALYGGQGHWEELCEVLLTATERISSMTAEQKIALYLRVAEIAQRQLKSPERAAKAYERILAVQGDHQGAATALVPIYRAQEKWARLLASYEILLGHAADDETRLAILADIRQLCEEKLGSKGLAFNWCEKAYKLRPTDPTLERELERLASEAEAWEELVEIYTAEVARETDPARQAERHRRIGRITLQRLRRPEEAQRHFEAVIERLPDDEEALATLEQLFTQASNFPPLIAIFKKHEAREKQLGKRLDLLFKIAWIEEEQVGDAKAAVATYRQILDADPSPATQMRALRAIEKLEADAGNWPKVAEALESQLAHVADADQRVQLEFQLGEIYEHKLDDRARALAHFRAAHAAAPSHKQTQAALERWIAPGAKVPGDDRVAVAQLLLPIYEQRDDAKRIVDCLEILLAAAPADDDDQQLGLLRRLANLVGNRLGDAKRAYEYTGRLFTRRPEDAENRRVMAGLADTLECPDDLAVRYGDAEEAAVKRGDLALARELAWDLGQLFEARLSMPDDAEKAYRRVLERDPENADAYIALVQLYSVNERWSELRKLLDAKKVRALDPGEKIGLLFQISDLDEGVLSDSDAAIADYLEILEMDAGTGEPSQKAFRALDRLYASKEDWRALDGLLERRVPFALQDADTMGTPESRAHVKFRRGELNANRLESPEKAADLFEEAIAEEPHHEAARKGLETLMKRPELRQRIARALEPLYVADEAWPKLALVLGAQREAADGAQAAALLVRLAEIQEEKLGARQLALGTWREALRIDPTQARTRANVERLATLLGKLPELVQAWEEALAAADSTDLTLRGELLEKIAELYEYELQDAGNARDAWKRLLELDPTNLHTSRPAAAALARLDEAGERWPELIGILHRQAEWADTVDERKELLFRIARIQEELSVDPQAATRTFREVLEADAADATALDALERLHTAQREWPELVEILRRKLELERSPNARRDLLWRIAQLTERELKDTSDAIAGYHALLDERADDVPAIEALARLYEQGDRNADLLEMLERQLALVDAKEQARGANTAFHAQRVALRMKIAGILEGFRRYDQALERFREVLDEDPRHEGARQGLERLLDDSELRLRAAEVLEPHYERMGELDKLVRLSELWAQHAPDPRERIARLRKIAELKEQSASAEGAFDALARAARVAVGEPDLPQLLDRLEKVAPQGGQRAALVALYQELGSDILDAAVQERVYLTVAGESHKLGDRSTAREYYRRVLDTTPDHAKALSALETIYLEGSEWEPLFEVYARRAELSQGDDEKRRHYLVLLAQLSERELDRSAEAMRAYEQVLEMYPADLDASKALEQHYRSAHRSADLAELLEKRLGFTDDLDEAVNLRFQLATIYDEELTDQERAVENYRATLGGDPTHEGAIRALEKYLDDDAQRVTAAEVLEPVYAARHDWSKLVRIYQIRLEVADDPKLRLALTRRIARLHEEQLEDLEGAFTWFGKVFREDPADRATRDQLARLAGILDGWARLVRIYEDWLADIRGQEDDVGIEVLRNLATIYQARLEDVEGARSCYQRLLGIDARDEAAFLNLEQLLTRAARWQDLLDVYRDAGEHTLDVERKKTLLFKQAGIQEEHRSDFDAAIDLYRAVLEIDSEDARAMSALDRLYTSGKRWHDLVELISRRLDGADENGWIALKLRLGAIYEAELEDRQAAIDAYEEVLGRQSAHPEAVRALERLIVVPAHTYRIAQILEPIYRAADAWQKLVVIYDAELEFIEDKPKRIELLREIARIHETRGGDGRLAFTALSRAWTEEAGEADGASGEREAALFADLSRLSRILLMWRPLVETLEKVAASSYDSELLARVHARIADIKESHLNDAPGEIESWRKVASARDDSLEAWMALERLLEQEGRSRDLVAVLEKRGTLSTETGEQKALAYRAAALYEGPLEEPEQAISTWRQVLTIDEDDRPALDALERLYRQKGAHRDLAGVVAHKAELSSDGSEKRTLRFELARIQEQELSDVFAAVDTYKAQLGADPKDREALAQLVRLYEGERLWSDHLEALDALAELAQGAEHTELAFRAAEVVEKQLAEVESAIGRYATVLNAEAPRPNGPFHAGARAALERLARDEASRRTAADVLEPFYEQRSEHLALVELTELRLQAASDPVERRALLQRIAELNERGLSDLQAAFAAWARVLADDPGDTSAQAELERLAEAQGAPDSLARVYEERLLAAFDPEVQRALALKLGQIYEQRLGDDERAIRSYNKALELPGGEGASPERVPLEALDRLLSRAHRSRELAEVLLKEAEVASDPAEQAEFYHRLGALRAGELVDLDGALPAFRDALERVPSHAGARQGLWGLLASPAHAGAALDVLEPLFDADGAHEQSVQLSEARLALTENPGDRVRLLERIAERCEKDLGDPGRAFEAIARAAAIEPGEAHLLDEVERLARVAGSDGLAGEALEKILGAGQLPVEIAREVGLRAARLWERMQDGRAEARYRGVLEADAESVEALEALDRIYRVRGDAAKLADVLVRRAEIELDVTQKKAFFAEAARLHEASLYDAARAVETWKRVLDVDEGDGAALDALARLYESGSRWQDLVDVLQQKVRFEEDTGAQAGHKARIAALYAERLGDVDKAVDAYRDLLDVAPESLAAIESLEELERKRKNFSAVQEVLVRKLQIVGAGAPQIPVYRQMIEVAAELAAEGHGQPEDAIGYLQEILTIAPDDERANRDLADLLEKTGKFHDLVDVLTQQANRRGEVGDRDGEVRLLVRAADLWEQKLGSPESATEILERILERDPDNVRALTSLARIYEGARELEKCRATLERAIALAHSGEEKAELYYRIGRLEAEANGEEAAEPHWARALEADYHHAQAAAALEKLARAKGDWGTVADLLSRREGSTPEGERRALYLELAQVLSERLHRAPAALPYLERALALSPDDPTVLEPLADLYFASDRLDDAGPLYQSLADRMQKARRMKDVGRLRYRLGAIAERRGDPAGALKEYTQAHQIDPSHALTLDALGRLHVAQSEWEKARGVYRKMLLQNLDPASGVTKADVYLRLGEIHEHLNEGPKAVGMYERGLEIDGSHARLKEALARVKR